MTVDAQGGPQGQQPEDKGRKSPEPGRAIGRCLQPGGRSRRGPAPAIENPGDDQCQDRVAQVQVLAHAMVKAKLVDQGAKNRVVHGRHQEANEVRRKDIGKAAAFHKDIPLDKKLGDHHSQHGRQADQEETAHKN